MSIYFRGEYNLQWICLATPCKKGLRQVMILYLALGVEGFRLLSVFAEVIIDTENCEHATNKVGCEYPADRLSKKSALFT